MSEAKRVTLAAISNTVSSTLMTAGSSSTLRFGADFLAPPDKPNAATPATAAAGGKGPNKTMRLKVELFQTDSNKYPEFDYAKLLHLERKKIKKLSKKSNGFSDPFEDNDDDVARIAKELERKYGSAYSSGRGKNKRDDVDIGLGYDESDSFIDNTEAYDEIIPVEVETIEGGFYINCGALEFKKLHTESMTTKTDEIIKMPNRPKKRVISSSSEESSSSDDEDDDDEDDDSEDDGDREDGGTGEETSAETQKSKSTTAAIGKKSKVANVNTSISNTAKKKAENGNALAKKKVKTVCGLSAGSSSNSPKPVTDDMATDSERERSVKKITSVKDMLKAQRDNYLKSRTNDVKSSNGENKDKSSEDEEDDDDETSSSEESDEDDSAGGNSDSNQSDSKEIKDKKTVSSNEENQGNEKLRSTDTKLPELDSDVLASVIKFKESVKSKNLIGKKFQFDDHLSESFLKIDDSLLCMDKPERNMVFAHFEYHLALPKYFFLRKAKQLRIKEEKLKSKRAFSKLHKAVSEAMPAVIANYETEIRRYGELQAFNGNSDQPPKMPKKKFPWNTNLRNLLYEVYQVRWTSYPVLGTRKETLEEFITSYMSKKVVEIWPKSWMRHEELQKEIEKRKTAAKRAKEKGKTQIAATVTTLPSILAPNTLQNAPQLIGNYNKQVEELSTRSNDNSETDSVASSSTLSLKRKNMEGACTTKQSKSKASKTNGEQKKSKNVNHTDSAISPSKKSDHSINHIISPTSAATAGTSCSLAQTTSTSIFSSTVAALSQPLKHSSNTHVIDLDFYTNPSEILQTTKQIQQQAAAGNAIFPQFAMANVAALSTTKPSSRRESSGDSEIEIVGVFPAKAPAKKQKTNSRSATPNAYQGVSEKTQSNNNNRNCKKQTNATPGALNLIGMDVNKAVNSFIDLRDDIEVKPILSTNANSSIQSTSSSSSVQLSIPQQ